MERKVKINKYYIVEYKNKAGMIVKSVAKKYKSGGDFGVGVGEADIDCYEDIITGENIIFEVTIEPLSESGLLTDEELKKKKIYKSRLLSIAKTLLTSDYNEEKTLSYKDNF